MLKIVLLSTALLTAHSDTDTVARAQLKEMISKSYHFVKSYHPDWHSIAFVVGSELLTF